MFVRKIFFAVEVYDVIIPQIVSFSFVCWSGDMVISNSSNDY